MSQTPLPADDFPQAQAALVAWRDADTEGRYGEVKVTLGPFVRRGRLVYADLKVRARAAATETSYPLAGGDDAALAASVRLFLAYALPKHLHGTTP